MKERLFRRDPILFGGGISLHSYTACDFVNRGDWHGTGGLPGVATSLVLVGMTGIYLWCFNNCMEQPNQDCNPDAASCDLDREIQELTCKRRKLSRCLLICIPILDIGSCISDPKQCLANHLAIRIIEAISNFFTRNHEKS